MAEIDLVPATILVVDDDDEVRKVLRLMLERAHYTVIEAANGKQALARAADTHVSVVITDLVMPEQEGLETIQVLRREQPGLKIIAMSGAFGGEFLKTAGLLGAHATLQKPLRLQSVLETIEKVLA
jgi:DNA-binding NtrC family response regulator